jgi:integrase
LKEVAKFEAHHKVGTAARLAFGLMLYTAQRRSDIVRLGRQHIDQDGWLCFNQQKTGTRVEIPILPNLTRSVEATTTGEMQFIVTSHGKPFTSNGFGNKFREWCNAAGLTDCSAHGIRKATAARLAELGCSEDEIAAITGHLTQKEVARYTKAARRRVMAASAMQKFQAGMEQEQNCPPRMRV